MPSGKSLLCTLCAVLLSASNLICATKDVGAKSPEHKNEENELGLDLNQSRSIVDDKNPQAKENARHVLSTLFADKEFREKFNDAMPMLRDLSPEQSLSFSALISSQLNSKSAHREEEKVTQIFGSKKSSAVVSLVHDVAKLLGTSANNLNGLEYSFPHKYMKLETLALKRMNQSDFDEKVVDPNGSRQRRSARLLHKLIRIPPPNSTEEIELQRINSPDLKLNTSSFAGPYTEQENDQQGLENATLLSYEQIEDLALADLNGTEIEPITEGSGDEALPNPEELVSGPRYRHSNKHRITHLKGDSKRKRIPVRSHQIKLLHKKCERFTASMCIKADDYPIDQIMGSIRRHKNAMSALLAEYRDKAAELEYQEQLEEYQFNSKRREDGSVITPGGMCASVVRYARPQKARSASGEWKYIVNTGRHTQTLRLEKCSTPQESCSYLSHNYRSRCTQVYNYHRLLSWDKTRGLHVDIFKVPSCCSCQVDGYRETFPPLGGSKHKDYTPVPDNNPYISINDEIDYEDDEDDDPSSAYQFSGAYEKNKHSFQNSELLLESKNIKTKVNHPGFNPTVGSYLSPPADVYNSQVSSKTKRPTYYTQSNKTPNGRSRKPFKNFTPNESRVDLGVPGIDQSTEDNTRQTQKRKRIYLGAPKNDNTYQTSGPFISSESVSSYVPTSGELATTTTYTGLNHNGRGPNNRKEVTNGKRINYNYHPIIDFFENHQKSGKPISTRNAAVSNSIPISPETSTLRDRRNGFGLEAQENNWHPVVVKS